MTSNFNFISSQFTHLAATLKEAEQQVYAAPPYAVVLCRKSLEEWVRWLYENDGDLQEPYDTTLNTLIHQQQFKDLLAPSLFKQVNLVRKMGNDAVHTNLTVKPTEALHLLQLMHSFTTWVVRVYSTGMPVIPPFNPELVPTVPDVVKTKQDLKKLEDAFLQTQELNRQLQEELERIKAVKESHAKVPPPQDPNEAVTRELYINLLLTEAGWDHTAANVGEYPVTGLPTADGKNNGTGYVDYVLWGDDGKPLAVVEAKRTGKDARIGQNQAKQYADSLQNMHGQRPVIFYTNGFETWLWDDVAYAPRRVHGLYKKAELEMLVQRRTSRQPLQSAPIDPVIADRYYQVAAIRSVGKVLETKGREALLVMATGTGKTRTAAALADVLSKCGWVKRILFLADRRELIRQAKKDFVNYLPNLPSVDLTEDRDPLHARIVFSTYQTMIGQIDELENGQRLYSAAHFDLVIFDEIHRSVYNSYKAIYEYFDAYKIGLTATPVSQADRDTYLLFGMDAGNPTYAYELDTAVADGFLVPPKGISVPLKFMRQGIQYDQLTPQEQRHYEETFADPLTGELPDAINKTALNKWLFNIGTVDKVIAHLMQNGIKVAGGDRLGKTIIFAASHKHAEFIQERFNVQYPEYMGQFSRVIDSYPSEEDKLLDKFKVKEGNPHIAISVDMLDTGIDVPEVVNLVFFKTVMSRTKFWQMIGRGTRLCKNLFAPGVDKDAFVIFDFCENFEFFAVKPEGVEAGLGKTLSQRLFEQRLRLTTLLQKQNDEALRQHGQQLQQGLHQQVQGLEDLRFQVRQHWRTVEKYKNPHSWNGLNELDLKELVDEISPLVNETREDEGAKRFDTLCYSLQLDILLQGQVGDSAKYNIQEVAAKLSKKGGIPAVAEKMALLQQVQTSQYWLDIGVSKAEGLRRDLRKLMRFIDRVPGAIVVSNLADEYLPMANDDGQVILSGANDLEAYRKRVTHYIQSQQTHITIYKLKMNIPITAGELDTLEKMMFAQGEIGTREQFEKAYGKQPLGKFIRAITGLDVTAAKEAFSKFVNAPALNTQQIKFVDTIIQYLTVNGTIDKGALFAPPFTDISSNGLLDVFNIEQSTEIVSMVKKINENALMAV